LVSFRRPIVTAPQRRRLEENRPDDTAGVATHTIDLIRGASHPALAGLVAGVVGISESAPGEVVRRQPAGGLLPLVLSWGGPLDIVSLSAGQGAGTYRSFVAGFMPGHVTTRFEEGQDCVQVYLTPLGVQRILGVPGRELACRVVSVDEVVPGLGDSFADRLGSAPSWRERFGLVADALLELASHGREPDDFVDWMWGQVEASGGRVRVSDLVDRSGWSHRHVTTRFSEQVGITPKAAVGVVRFVNACADLGRLPVAEAAARHGYADQSHLTREVVRYAGESPMALVAARRPTAYTALDAAKEPTT
jgi:AraC-like DNA-binding protein